MFLPVLYLSFFDFHTFITLEQFHLHQTEETVSQPPHQVSHQKCNGTRYFGDKGPQYLGM